jgi:hypothetical protein
MKTELIAKYLTKSGQIGFEVFRTTFASGKVGYRYSGKFGAGCGDLQQIKNAIAVTLASKRGIQTIIAI